MTSALQWKRSADRLYWCAAEPGFQPNFHQLRVWGWLGEDKTLRVVHPKTHCGPKTHSNCLYDTPIRSIKQIARKALSVFQACAQRHNSTLDEVPFTQTKNYSMHHSSADVGNIKEANFLENLTAIAFESVGEFDIMLFHKFLFYWRHPDVP